MNTKSALCGLCGIVKPLSCMYSRKLNGIIKYSIGCKI